VKLVKHIIEVEVTPALCFLPSVISTWRAWNLLNWDTTLGVFKLLHVEDQNVKQHDDHSEFIFDFHLMAVTGRGR
jgi:hypothetical protein